MRVHRLLVISSIRVRWIGCWVGRRSASLDLGLLLLQLWFGALLRLEQLRLEFRFVLILSALLQLKQTLLQILHFGNQALLLKFHDHFLLHDSVVLLSIGLEGGLILVDKDVLFLVDVLGQLLLLLLHSPVIDLLVVTLLLQLLEGSLRFLSEDPCLVQLFLKLLQFVSQ